MQNLYYLDCSFSLTSRCDAILVYFPHQAKCSDGAVYSWGLGTYSSFYFVLVLSCFTPVLLLNSKTCSLCNWVNLLDIQTPSWQVNVVNWADSHPLWRSKWMARWNTTRCLFCSTTSLLARCTSAPAKRGSWRAPQGSAPTRTLRYLIFGACIFISWIFGVVSDAQQFYSALNICWKTIKLLPIILIATSYSLCILYHYSCCSAWPTWRPWAAAPTTAWWWSSGTLSMPAGWTITVNWGWVATTRRPETIWCVTLFCLFV